MLALTSAKAATIAVDIGLFLACVFLIGCIKGAASDLDRPRSEDVDERWWDE